jgi:hypothetical protein
MVMTAKGGGTLRYNNVQKFKRPGDTNEQAYERYKAYMRQIGSKGGQLGHDGGFASHKVGSDGLTGRDRAVIAGSIGGRKSRRTAK